MALLLQFSYWRGLDKTTRVHFALGKKKKSPKYHILPKLELHQMSSTSTNNDSFLVKLSGGRATCLLQK